VTAWWLAALLAASDPAGLTVARETAAGREILEVRGTEWRRLRIDICGAMALETGRAAATPPAPGVCAMPSYYGARPRVLAACDTGRRTLAHPNPDALAQQLEGLLQPGSLRQADPAAFTAALRKTPLRVWLTPPARRGATAWLRDAAQYRFQSYAPPAAPPGVPEGTVVLDLIVEPEAGSVFAVHRVSGDPLLSRLAIQAARDWRFELETFPAVEPYRVVIEFGDPCRAR
jgi:hypothetical protein